MYKLKRKLLIARMRAFVLLEMFGLVSHSLVNDIIDLTEYEIKELRNRRVIKWIKK